MRRLSRQRNDAVPLGDAALRGREEPTKRAVRWNLALVWFMRLMALLWIAKGLSFWAVIVGAGHGPSFEEKGLGFQATVVYFAVVDPVAAVTSGRLEIARGSMFALFPLVGPARALLAAARAVPTELPDSIR